MCYVSVSYADDAHGFVEPESWTVGDLDSTYQEWDVLLYAQGNIPDVGYITNGPITSDPTLSALPPGFHSGSNNFYSFAGDYGIECVIYNHGGTSGSGSYGPADGTRVLIQTAATMNMDPGAGGPASVFIDTLRIVDEEGIPVSGGSFEDAIRIEELWLGEVPGGHGNPVWQQELLWEFYLPGYTDDFTILADVIVHSSFKQMRVDTLIMPAICPGDANCDGAINWRDIDYLVAGMNDNLDAWENMFLPGTPSCNFANCDVDADGSVNWRDIDPFVELMNTTCP